jgi:hypothetical protein
MPELTLRGRLGFMVRPRWHDVAIVGAIAAILAVGVWALWWDDVRGLWHPHEAPSETPAPAANGQT